MNKRLRRNLNDGQYDISRIEVLLLVVVVVGYLRNWIMRLQNVAPPETMGLNIMALLFQVTSI